MLNSLMIIGIIFTVLVIMFFIYSFIPSNIRKKKFFKRKKEEEKILYLTFDDGPGEYTDRLLDLLNKYKVKSTFFCVARFAVENEKIIDKMKNEGHTIALHSLKHKNAMIQGIIETKIDLKKSIQLMDKMGIEIKYYRPPWGDSNLCLARELKKRGIKLVWWDVMAEDWEAHTTAEVIANKLETRASNGDIICLHDGRGKNNAPLKTIEALEIVLPKFIEEGYRVKTIDEYKF